MWLLNQLKRKGYSAILLENDAIGGKQTLASQGIIHGGVKYSLRGKEISSATHSIAAMPARWHSMISGNPSGDDPDLSAYHLVRSPAYHLWIRNALPRISGFFAERKLHSRLTLLDLDLLHLDKKRQRGRLYRLNGEFVINVPQLVHRLAEKHQDAIFSTKAMSVMLNRDRQNDFYLDLSHQDTRNDQPVCRILAKQFITTAGAGTEALLQQTNLTDIVPMQRRPLHMVMARHNPPFSSNFIPQVFMHVVGWSDKPMLTITSHTTASGACVWYIGGNIAEQGVYMEKLALLKKVKGILKSFFPINWNKVAWDTLWIDRAEAAQGNKARPDNPYWRQLANLMICWPTKLTLVPILADQVIERLEKQEMKKNPLPSADIAQSLHSISLTKPDFGLAPWEKAEWMSLK